MLITRVISYGTDILLVFLAVYLFSFYFDIFFIRKKGKTVLITGYITFTAWQLIISNVSAWPVYVNICITTIVTFVSVMTAYEGEFWNKCIFAFVFNAIWMMIETSLIALTVLVILISQYVGIVKFKIEKSKNER